VVVVPRPASTVVLLDDQSRVYLTKRPHTMKFLGGFYVFPGGAVDKEDEISESPYILNFSEKNIEVDVSFYIAAARELFEEVGVLLAASQEGMQDLNPEKVQEYRRRIIAGEMSFIELLKTEKLYFDVKQLRYFGSFVTPEGNRYRYDTSFFLARLPKGQHPDPDEYEIEDAFWITPEEALHEYEKGRLPMIRPTILSLKTVLNYQQGQPLRLPSHLSL